jgi:hypothetical protein
LYEDLEDNNFVVIAVALETGGAATATEWIQKANPTYPCLIDEHHTVAKLYGMINVPTAVWIDEMGRVVRPSEPAGASIPERDPKTGQVSDEARERSQARKTYYFQAVRDWAHKGDSSVHSLSASEAQQRVVTPVGENPLAAANFSMAVYLHQQGFQEDAKGYFHEAARLEPMRWNYRRQIWNLIPDLDARGEFRDALKDWGDDPYIAPIIMDGIP